MQATQSGRPIAKCKSHQQIANASGYSGRDQRVDHPHNVMTARKRTLRMGAEFRRFSNNHCLFRQAYALHCRIP